MMVSTNHHSKMEVVLILFEMLKSGLPFVNYNQMVTQ